MWPSFILLWGHDRENSVDTVRITSLPTAYTIALKEQARSLKTVLPPFSLKERDDAFIENLGHGSRILTWMFAIMSDLDRKAAREAADTTPVFVRLTPGRIDLPLKNPPTRGAAIARQGMTFAVVSIQVLPIWVPQGIQSLGNYLDMEVIPATERDLRGSMDLKGICHLQHLVGRVDNKDRKPKI